MKKLELVITRSSNILNNLSSSIITNQNPNRLTTFAINTFENQNIRSNSSCLSIGLRTIAVILVLPWILDSIATIVAADTALDDATTVGSGAAAAGTAIAGTSLLMISAAAIYQLMPRFR